MDDTTQARIKKLRDDFSTQLEQASQNHSRLSNQLIMLEKQQEQLKGALYAVDQMAALFKDETDSKIKTTKKETDDGKKDK